MQGLNGVASKPFIYCMVALALPGLVWLLWGERVTAVIEAYIKGSPPWIVLLVFFFLHPPAPFRTGKKQCGEKRTDLPSSSKSN